MKKLITMLSVLIIALLLLPTTLSAQTSEQQSSESLNALNRYLQYVQAGQVDQVVSLVQDTRFPSSSLHTEYSKLFDDSNQKLISYEITNVVSSTRTQAMYLTKLTFLNGSIQQVPFELRYDNGWKVWITPETLEDNLYKQLTAPTTKFSLSDNNNSTYAVSNLISWNFSGRSEGYYFYSINSVNFTKTSNEKVYLNLQQWVDNNKGGVPDIEYAIIEQSWMGDVIWGTVTGTGTYNSKTKTLTMTGIDQDVSNGKLRFKIRVTNTDSTHSGSGYAYIE